MALQNRRKTKGRHPLLRIGSLAQRIFNTLKETPDMTIPELAKLLMEGKQTINGMLQRMKGEGLVITVPKQKGNRTVIGYRAVTENETGFARDKVEVEVTFYVNDYGEYSATAKVVNELPGARTSSGLRVIHKHVFYAAVPKPTE